MELGNEAVGFFLIHHHETQVEVAGSLGEKVYPPFFEGGEYGREFMQNGSYVAANEADRGTWRHNFCAAESRQFMNERLQSGGVQCVGSWVERDRHIGL